MAQGPLPCFKANLCEVSARQPDIVAEEIFWFSYPCGAFRHCQPTRSAEQRQQMGLQVLRFECEVREMMLFV